MLLSEWRKTAPNLECMSNKVLAVLMPVLADLGAYGDPACWVIWGEDPEFRYSVMAPTPAGLATIAVRLSGGEEGPRATGKLVRWAKLQVSELNVEASGSNRLVALQIEGQVLRGMDEEADQICEFVRGLLAGIDGRTWQAAGPIVLSAMPQVVAVPTAAPAAMAGAPKAAGRPGVRAAPKPGRAAPEPGRAAPKPGRAAPEPGRAAPKPGRPAPGAPGKASARKSGAKGPGSKPQAAWVAPHPIPLPAARALPAPAGTPAAKPAAPKPRAAKPATPKPPAHTAAAAAAHKSQEQLPTEPGSVWEVPRPTKSLVGETKRPRTWTP
jgi:hypothetical protein